MCPPYSAHPKLADQKTTQLASQRSSEQWSLSRALMSPAGTPSPSSRRAAASSAPRRLRLPRGSADASSPYNAPMASPLQSPGLDARLDAPVNPFEPTYCTCSQVAFGEMIACDADDCPVEWFHCACVGIAPSNRPKNDWYCPLCAPKHSASASSTPAAVSAASDREPMSTASAAATGGHVGGVGGSGDALGELSALATTHGSELAAALLGGALPELLLGPHRGDQPEHRTAAGTQPDRSQGPKRPRSGTGGSDAISDASISALMQEVVADAAGVDKHWSVHSPARKAASAVASERLRRAAKRRRRLEAVAASGRGGGVWGGHGDSDSGEDSEAQDSSANEAASDSSHEVVELSSESASSAASGDSDSDSAGSSSGSDVPPARQGARRPRGGVKRKLPRRGARPSSLKE